MTNAYRVASVGRSLATTDLRAGVRLRAAPRLAEVVRDLAGVDLEGAGGVAGLCAHKAGESRGDDKGGVEHVDGGGVVVVRAMNLRASSAKEHIARGCREGCWRTIDQPFVLCCEG